MAIKLISARESALSQGIKVLVHGLAGSGKTVLCTTTQEPTVIISAEAGLLSIAHTDVPVIEVGSIDDVREAYEFLLTDEGRAFSWVALDSISEIAEVVLAYEKSQTKDPRKAYGELQDQMMQLLRAFRDLPGRNVVMTCKQEKVKDEHSGQILYSPLMPGSKLAQQIPYLFDEVFALRVEKDAEGNSQRWLQTGRDIQYEAKDRSGLLDMFEPPSLYDIAMKIRGEQSTRKAVNQ